MEYDPLCPREPIATTGDPKAALTMLNALGGMVCCNSERLPNGEQIPAGPQCTDGRHGR